MVMSLRHPTSAPLRAPQRGGKPAPRGASRMVAKQPVRLSLPRPDFSPLKRLLWPLALVVLGLGVYEGTQRLLPYADRPISRISVQGDLRYISQQAVQERIAPFAAASFLEVDLAAMRGELEQMSWIASAEVRRVWPDQLVIRLEEQLPIARWGEQALLNNQGQAFAPRELEHYQHLPQLVGPQRAKEQVMQQYQVLSQLLRPLGFSIARLELRERGSWYLTTTANAEGHSLELLLGRDNLVEKLRRFIAIHEAELKPQLANIQRVDLRYPNGLAVAWRQVEPAVAPATAGN